jgi:hypothetical protein
MIPNPLDLRDVVGYVENNIGMFHAKRLQKLENLKLNRLLLRKNPYLFKAKNILTAESLVKSVLDAFLSSQEETLFGDFLEGVAVFVCGQVYGGEKPATTYLEGIDLVFENDGKVYMVEIKSGPHWGNSSQIKKMLLNFKSAKAILQAKYPGVEIIAVNGCSYGTEPNPVQRQGEYLKLCGQDFWRFISNNDQLYTQIIEPLGHQAKQKNDMFYESYAMLVNRFTLQFATEYCLPSGMIDWEKLVRHVSARRSGTSYPLENNI